MNATIPLRLGYKRAKGKPVCYLNTYFSSNSTP